jgi:hypothetical protein
MRMSLTDHLQNILSHCLSPTDHGRLRPCSRFTASQWETDDINFIFQRNLPTQFEQSKVIIVVPALVVGVLDNQLDVVVFLGSLLYNTAVFADFYAVQSWISSSVGRKKIIKTL